MPAIQRGTVEQALQARRWDRRHVPSLHNNRSSMSPVAFAFLIPVFVVFFFAPFLCIYIARKRRQRRRRRQPPVVAQQTREPSMGRADAREMLEFVPEIANVTYDVKSASQEAVEEKRRFDSVSMLEKDCAICLSTLHAPSPPEPVLLRNEATSANTTVKAPSVKYPSFAENKILGLKVCGHEFHAECLASWFAIRKTSCPICRAMCCIDETKKTSIIEDQGPVTSIATTDTLANRLAPARRWQLFRTGQVIGAFRAGGNRSNSR